MCKSRHFASLILTLSVIFGATSCEHKELCFYHPHTAPVRVLVDWSLFPMEEPTGMTAYAFPLNEEKEEDYYRFISHNVKYITLNLEQGAFHTLVFNQSESEYGSLEFSNLEDYNTAEVRVAEVEWKSNWYATKTPETKVGVEPEWLAVGRAENIEVTEEMVQAAEDAYLAEHQHQIIGGIKTKADNDVATVYPISVIKQVEFKVYCEGLYNLRSIRASIDGMAEGCFLATGKNTANQVSHTIDKWDVIADPYDITRGDAIATLGTFGIPSSHNGIAEDNKFSIHLLLVDNKTVVDYDFYIGDILAQFNEMDGLDGEIQKVIVNLRLPERLPDVEPVGGEDGGFDVNFDNWGDEIITEIPI